MQHKHIPYGFLKTNTIRTSNNSSNNSYSSNPSTNMTDDISTSNTEPLLPEGSVGPDGIDPNIPPLNAEDPLLGLTTGQVEKSRELFGKNEIVIPETPLWMLFLRQFIGFLVRSLLYVLCFCLIVTVCCLGSSGAADNHIGLQWGEAGGAYLVLIMSSCTLTFYPPTPPPETANPNFSSRHNLSRVTRLARFCYHLSHAFL